MTRFAAAFLLLLTLPGCSGNDPETYRQQLFAFGTIVDITISGTENSKARATVQQIDALFQQQHRDWHAWQKGQLNNLNQAIAAGKSAHTSPSIIALIRLGQQFERSSKGLFNPAIGHLLEIWGFQQDDPSQRTPPDDSRIQYWLAAAPSTLNLQIREDTVSSTNPAVKLDFGGFAKGYSIGRAVDLLEKAGISNFIVNAGGDLCARGKHADHPWRVGIRHPRRSGLLGTLDLPDPICVFTSGDYERFFDYQGQRYHHILDPRNGYPVTATASVTVLANEPALADAAATAILVAGGERWRELAESMNIKEVLLIDSNGEFSVSPSLSERMLLDEGE